MKRIGCELGYSDDGVGNDSGCGPGRCEGKLGMCRIGNGCGYVLVDGNGNKPRQIKDDLEIKEFIQNYPSNKPHCIQQCGVLRS